MNSFRARKSTPKFTPWSNRNENYHMHGCIRSSGYLNSKCCTPTKYKWTVTMLRWYSSCTFDENLQKHISNELADDVGRESDMS